MLDSPASAQDTPAPLRYRIAPLDAHAHLFEVRCTVADPDPAGQRFRLPAWIPGSYLIREFARHFVTVRAESEGRPVALAKEAKDCWRAAPTPGPVTVVAAVYAYDLSVRAAYLDASRGYFNGACVFLLPEGRDGRRCEVEIAAPAGDVGAAWRVATTLSVVAVSPSGFGRYAARDYDALIDHPVEMADWAATTFTAGGVPHQVAVSGRHRADLDRLGRDLARVCQWQCDLFGGAPGSAAPFERYLFLVAAVGDGYGGLEHRSSTSLVCRRDDLPQPGNAAVGDDYLRFLGLASHEYFHSWNVKRIKPAAFLPYDLSREAYTRQLWAFEGITSYYDDLALVRSGVVAPDRYLELVGRNVTAVLRTPGRLRQSVADSSFDAWIKYYRRDENAPNAVVSYYQKGALVALGLDLTLRARGSSLDALMRALWERHGRSGVGVPEDGIPRLATELAGRNLDDFFARYVDGTEDPPLAELLADVGVTLHLRAAKDASDRGGRPAPPEDEARVTLGCDLAPGRQAKLAHVHNGGPAEAAGLAAGDVLVAIDGLRATAAMVGGIRRHRRPGESLAVHAFRRDELVATKLTLAAAPRDTCWLERDPHAGAAACARRAAWLGESA